MSPSLNNHRGTLRIDRVFRGIEIKRATGCANTPRGRQVAARIEAMLEAHADPVSERLDLLRDVALGSIKLLDLYQRYRRGELHLLQGGATLKLLRPTWTAWVERSGGANVGNRTYCLEALFHKLPTAETETVGDLPRLLRRLMDRYREEGKATTANQYRALVLAFIRDVVGKRNEVRHQAADVPMIPHKSKRGHPVDVVEAVRIRDALPAPHGAMWWTLCLTGMRIRAEYLAGQFDGLDDRILVHGQKTAKSTDSSERVIPLVAAPATPDRAYKAFRLQLAKVAPEIEPYDARRTYANWMVKAGIPKVRRDCYRGHSSQAMADLYEWHDVRVHLIADAKRIRRMIATALKEKADAGKSSPTISPTKRRAGVGR